MLTAIEKSPLTSTKILVQNATEQGAPLNDTHLRIRFHTVVAVVSVVIVVVV